MMDYYSEMPGPTKEAVKEGFKRNLKPVLRDRAAVPESLADRVDIDNLIDESINEGVDKAYKSYSSSGWNVFGREECTKAVEEFFFRKLAAVKVEIERQNLQKQFERETKLGHPHVQEIAKHIGGRRKTKRNRRKSSRRGGNPEKSAMLRKKRVAEEQNALGNQYGGGKRRALSNWRKIRSSRKSFRRKFRKKPTPRKKSASWSDGDLNDSLSPSGHSSPRARSDSSLSAYQRARLGLPYSMPPVVAAMIGKRANDIGRLEQIIGILEHMQTNPEIFRTPFRHLGPWPAVDKANMDIANILEGIENKEILEYPVTFTETGGGYRYDQTWRLVGDTSPMQVTGKRATQEHGLCKRTGGTLAGQKYECLCSTRGWDGTKPGERWDDPYSAALVGSISVEEGEGWFHGEIRFLREVIAELRRTPVIRVGGQRRTRKISNKARTKSNQYGGGKRRSKRKSRKKRSTRKGKRGKGKKK